MKKPVFKPVPGSLDLRRVPQQREQVNATRLREIPLNTAILDREQTLQITDVGFPKRLTATVETILRPAQVRLINGFNIVLNGRVGRTGD